MPEKFLYFLKLTSYRLNKECWNLNINKELERYLTKLENFQDFREISFQEVGLILSVLSSLYHRRLDDFEKEVYRFYERLSTSFERHKERLRKLAETEKKVEEERNSTQELSQNESTQQQQSQPQNITNNPEVIQNDISVNTELSPDEKKKIRKHPKKKSNEHTEENLDLYLSSVFNVLKTYFKNCDDELETNNELNFYDNLPVFTSIDKRLMRKCCELFLNCLNEHITFAAAIKMFLTINENEIEQNKIISSTLLVYEKRRLLAAKMTLLVEIRNRHLTKNMCDATEKIKLFLKEYLNSETILNNTLSVYDTPKSAHDYEFQLNFDDNIDLADILNEITEIPSVDHTEIDNNIHVKDCVVLVSRLSSEVINKYQKHLQDAESEGISSKISENMDNILNDITKECTVSIQRFPEEILNKYILTIDTESEIELDTELSDWFDEYENAQYFKKTNENAMMLNKVRFYNIFSLPFRALRKKSYFKLPDDIMDYALERQRKEKEKIKLQKKNKAALEKFLRKTDVNFQSKHKEKITVKSVVQNLDVSTTPGKCCSNRSVSNTSSNVLTQDSGYVSNGEIVEEFFAKDSDVFDFEPSHISATSVSSNTINDKDNDNHSIPEITIPGDNISTVSDLCINNTPSEFTENIDETSERLQDIQDLIESDIKNSQIFQDIQENCNILPSDMLNNKGDTINDLSNNAEFSANSSEEVNNLMNVTCNTPCSTVTLNSAIKYDGNFEELNQIPEGRFLNTVASQVQRYKLLEEHKVEIAKNVEEWERFIRPRLETCENRNTFDIHDYENNILQKCSENNPVPFEHIVQGQLSGEIARYFLACLQLTNDGNIDIVEKQFHPIGIDIFQIKKLSNTRNYQQLNSNVTKLEELSKNKKVQLTESVDEYIKSYQSVEFSDKERENLKRCYSSNYQKYSKRLKPTVVKDASKTNNLHNFDKYTFSNSTCGSNSNHLTTVIVNNDLEHSKNTIINSRNDRISECLKTTVVNSKFQSNNLCNSDKNTIVNSRNTGSFENFTIAPVKSALVSNCVNYLGNSDSLKCLKTSKVNSDSGYNGSFNFNKNTIVNTTCDSNQKQKTIPVDSEPGSSNLYNSNKNTVVTPTTVGNSNYCYITVNYKKENYQSRSSDRNQCLYTYTPRKRKIIDSDDQDTKKYCYTTANNNTIFNDTSSCRINFDCTDQLQSQKICDNSILFSTPKKSTNIVPRLLETTFSTQTLSPILPTDVIQESYQSTK